MTIEGRGFDRYMPSKPLNYQDYYKTDQIVLNKKREDCNAEELELRDALIKQQIDNARYSFRDNPEVLRALAESYVSYKPKSDVDNVNAL